LARTFRDFEEAALVRQIDDRIAELQSGENGAAILTLNCGNSARAANISGPTRCEAAREAITSIQCSQRKDRSRRTN
jgi:hypothetical protein